VNIEVSTMRKAFTLVELLVVVAILALLIALLTPTLNKARYQTKLVLCKNQMSQMSFGILTYTNDYRGKFPDGAWGRRDPTSIGMIESGSGFTRAEGDFDLRPAFRKYFGVQNLNEIMKCPVAARWWYGDSFYTNIDSYNMSAFNQCKSPYAFYFGQRAVNDSGANVDHKWPRRKTMERVGQMWVPDGIPSNVTMEFSLLMSDFAFYGAGGGTPLATPHRPATGNVPEGGNYANFNMGSLYNFDQITNGNFATTDGGIQTIYFELDDINEGTFTGIRRQTSGTYMVPTP
jgi:prepilin-type N-terminal cleavage/methylation domain-containing protein